MSGSTVAKTPPVVTDNSQVKPKNPGFLDWLFSSFSNKNSSQPTSTPTTSAANNPKEATSTQIPADNNPQPEAAEPEVNTQPVVIPDIKIDRDKEYHLIVSHNNRIQSWLNLLLKTNQYYLDIFSNKKTKKMRYSNCAAISMEFNKYSVIIKMVYPGDKTSNKTNGEPYWGFENDDSNNIIKFEDLTIQLGTFFQVLGIPNNDEKLINNLIGKNFLIVRHGEAEHNVVMIANIKHDTLLTKKGIEQCAKFGELLKNSSAKINARCYVSDLIRTGMTAWAIGIQLFGNYSSDNNKSIQQYNSFTEYIVVPCNTEVKDEGGDNTNQIITMVRNENKTDCNFNETCLNATPQNCKDCPRCFYFEKTVDEIYGTPKKCPLDAKGLIKPDYKYSVIDLREKYNFEYYKAFYKNKENKCKDDFFQQLNNTMGYSANQQQVGTAAAAGGRKFKKTQKLKKGKKFTKKGGKKKFRKTYKK